MDTFEQLPRWEQRFRAARFTLPAWAKQAPERCVFVSDRTGTAQVYFWDRSLGEVRQMTDRPSGARHCAVESSGRALWWFADTDGDEFGQWMRQPLDGGPAAPAAPGTGKSWPSGLAMGLADHTLLGCSTEEGTSIHLVLPDGKTRDLYRHKEAAYAVDLSRSLDLAVIAHSEHGDLWDLGVRVLDLRGAPVADIATGGEGLQAIGFAPVLGDSRLLLLHHLDDRWEPVIVDPHSGEQSDISLRLPGDLQVEWCAGGSALLIQQDHQARSRLYRYDLTARQLTELPVPSGTIEHARARPDGDVWLLRSSSAQPPQLTSLASAPGFPSGLLPPESVAAQDLWADGPGGPVHALVSLPPGTAGPCPAVFLLHGGPDEHDQDAFDPVVAAWVDHGFAVIRVNYRGSTGYGPAWTEALRQAVGLTELEDVAAIRSLAVEQGLVDPGRLVLAGWSWGGYLTLLGLGTQPTDWAVGLAGAPVADPAAAYRDSMEEIRALDRSLFGGTPDEVPDRYRAASPSTYLDSVRSPVLVIAAANDARCPPGQIEAYAKALSQRGVPCAYHLTDDGHSTTSTDNRVALFRLQLEFAVTHLRPAGSPAGQTV
ncbi:prolyl oligopeptidase family serine peptidase [Streptomyces sp. NPDC002599]|uniref:S9 family peptidase n=1 Tax=Streptomyces sp. NPDC002599 TaxID=3154421 RepID=UPI003321BABD